ncbi:MAG: class I SAM-dependent methyltransferase [Anaerolineae bacterium]|nr:class I SAM-dependent methyltransferase [Anaerolineae bacterium]
MAGSIKQQQAERRQGKGQAGMLPPPEQKATHVRTMFGRIARRYDLMNRLMALGRDRAWRRYTVQQLDFGLEARHAQSKSRIVLDVATGTGNLALEALRQYPDIRVVGLDFTPEMLALAREKAGAPAASLAWVVADALRLPFASASFDGVVTGFALRNVTDIPTAFAEMARVTQPGGRVASLEIAKPGAPIFRRLFGFYFYRIVPLIGGLIGGQKAAYTYLPHSLTSFMTPDEIAAAMRQTGWDQVRHRRLTMGTVTVHAGVRGFGSFVRPREL